MSPSTCFILVREILAERLNTPDAEYVKRIGIIGKMKRNSLWGIAVKTNR